MFCAAALALPALTLPVCVAAETSLPKVTILGKTFFYYETKKDESFFGVAKKFGWDPDVLAAANPEVELPLQKGSLLYYPAPKEKKKGSPEATATIDPETPITHTVESGETIYGIAKFYNIPVDTIYAMNPAARDGVKKGDVLTLTTKEDVVEDPADGIVYHTVSEDESTYGIAKAYNTTVEDIYRLNPGLPAGNPDPGERIRVAAGSLIADAKTEIVQQQQIDGLSSYKVRRGDTWLSIAEANGIGVDMLRAANPDKKKIKRGDTIALPSVTTVEVEQYVVEEDPREKTEEGRQELYNEIHGITDDSVTTENPSVGVAVLLDDPDSNKDMEFARGAIAAADYLKDRPFATRLTVLDSRKPMAELLSELDAFSPDLIVTTADKQLPAFLKDFAKDHSVMLVNAFDVKDEAFLDNPYVVQYLAPTSYFNDEVASYIAEKYNGYSLILAGHLSPTDTMGEAVMRKMMAQSTGAVEEIAVADIPEFSVTSDSKILFYATPAGKEDAKSMLERIYALKEDNPLADIRVLGRPSWITFSDNLRQLFGDDYVIMPSRFYFDPSQPAARTFIDDYKEIFGQTPMRSFPVYSATAYDILRYFLPNLHATSGDFNAGFKPEQTLQSDISLKRVNNWGGIVNPQVFVIEFEPLGTYNKTVLPR